MGTLGPALVGGIAGLVVAGIGIVSAIITARHHRAREHDNWLRDQRLRHSVDFVTAVRRLINEYRRAGEAGMNQDEREDLRARMRTARTAIELLCSPTAVAAARTVNDLLYQTTPGEPADHRQTTEAAFQATVEALRAELTPAAATAHRKPRVPEF
ncbi:hypothetical protein JIG36_42760 [Actinoplanes sp. LDG1-06]|uniref:Protein kilB n=1 Tax=Paractinoplanes ovalisporus TaxID=2810368 RepID=A0ABS2AR05_9ACTN|nr:hypothetical protein [Actinoplanes ovalisporus]MBM2622246.1 hypothetical protein [Actinoplanes ovalisporus]